MDKLNCEAGARVVVKAWTQPEYRVRLLADGTAALAELGIEGTGQSADLVAVENTPTRHNLVVCTLCSCCACSTHSNSHLVTACLSASLHTAALVMRTEKGHCNLTEKCRCRWWGAQMRAGSSVGHRITSSPAATAPAPSVPHAPSLLSSASPSTQVGSTPLSRPPQTQ